MNELTLKNRVIAFKCFELPGQPMMSHMGTSYLVNDLAKEVEKLEATNKELLDVLKELQESASYWIEYDVPIGIVDSINAAIARATKGAQT